ncbi:hypothetical protein KO500_11860 [Cellulophaga baltica]|uniref:TapB family protein n=1 Tax=Cellulophaga TaxID=104264 RepID=UPI001C07C85D|nr:MULTISPECIES: hypothetical protein [Cellulophaga]MBU2997135.1 hypothetical protein [Cellulophaga baltica]MDO6768533.1 hypothetical protein [Cellulophaga sp. 1_MG-2023]
MKIKLLILILGFSIQGIISQNCEAISPYKQGTTLEYTNYNKKGKVKSVDNYTVKSVTTENGEMLITIDTTTKNKKNDSATNTQILRCVNGDFYVSLSDYLSHQNDNQESTLELKAEGDFVEFPDDIKEGYELKDATIDLKMGGGDDTSGVSFANMEVRNRKVLQEENFTINDYEFNAYKVSFDYVFTMSILKIRGSGIEWYVKGVGIVKTESYSKKGKLKWTRELTKLN